MAIFEAFISGVGNFIIRALAGTGKTTTNAEGIRRFCAKHPTLRVLFTVFMTKNREDMQAKLNHPNVDISTLHSAGLKVVKRFWGNRIKGDKWTEGNRIKTLVPDVPLDVLMATIKLLGFLKNGFCTMPTLEQMQEVCDLRQIEVGKDSKAKGWNTDKLCDLALRVMELSKIRPSDNCISFDDMIWLPNVMGWIQPEYDLVVVDEFQDMNLPQLSLAVGLCKPDGRVFFTGDTNQAMYGWRGAMVNSHEVFKQRLNATELTLTTTYRCPKLVVERAKAFVPDFIAHDSAPDGIVETLEPGKALELVSPGTSAILSRINAPLMSTCLVLLKRGITAYIEGKDIAKTLNGIVKTVGGKDVSEFITNLEAWQTQGLAKAVGRNGPAKAELIQDQFSMLSELADVCNSIAEIENKLNLLFEDSQYVRKPGVVCSSVHRAKGLEWNTVLVYQDTFNRCRSDSSPDAIQEEKNIQYVALTRAKERLVLTNTPQRKQP